MAIFFLLFLFSASAFGGCELKRQKSVKGNYEGAYYITSMNAGVITLDQKHGNLTDDKNRFNLDLLHEIKGGGMTSRFRIGERFFESGSTHLGMMQLELGSTPLPPGLYKFSTLIAQKNQHDPTLTMIGDSITWWSEGNSFRCLLSPHLTSIKFLGSHTDTFGYGHAGEGGDTTLDILRRLDSISEADYYFLLAGTNDWKASLTPQQTFSNLKMIAKRLSSKGSLVIISTLLPRLDGHDSRILQVNSLLRAWDGFDCNCKLVELDIGFRKISNKEQLYWDKGVHPNTKGYERITEILGPQMSGIVNQNLRRPKN